METTLKQRILGIIVLVALLGFCLTVLLRGNKNAQPHIAQINTHPPIAQTTTAMLGNNSVANNTTTTSTPTSIPAPTTTTTAVTTSIPSTPTSLPTLPQPQQSAASSLSKMPTPTTTTQASTLQNTAPIAVSAPAPSVPPVQTVSSVSSVSKSPAPQVSAASTTSTEPTSVVSTSKPIVHKKNSHQVSTTYFSSKAENTGEKNLVVQVGTFTLPANAETLVDKLHSKGFVATMQKMNTSKGQMTRVIVGKKGLNRAQAQALRQKLQKTLQLQGIVVSHEPAITTSTAKKANKKIQKTSNQTQATLEDSEN